MPIRHSSNRGYNVETGLFDEITGYSGTEDTYLYGRWGDGGSAGGPYRLNYGDLTSLSIAGVPWSTNNNKPALIRFNDIFGSGPGQVPATGALVTEATLRLFITTSYDDNGGVDSLKFVPMWTDWAEGTGTGQTDVYGASTYSFRYLRTDDEYVANPEDCWGTGMATLPPDGDASWNTGGPDRWPGYGLVRCPGRHRHVYQRRRRRLDGSRHHRYGSGLAAG